LGALVASFSRNGKNVVPKVVRMLAVLQHRGRDMCGIATPDFLEISRSVQELTSLDIGSNVAIGHNFSRILPKDVPQPVQDRDSKIVFEGRFFPPLAENEAQEIMKSGGKNIQEKARNVIKNMDGSYAFAFLTSHRIILGRDPVGPTPLYYGEENEIFAFASERRALWTLGVQNAKSFPPGNLAITDDKGMSFQPVRTIIKPDAKPILMGDAANRLQSLLIQSIGERILDAKRVALAFSGGLDSSVIASFAKKYDSEIQLIHVGMEGQPEIQQVKGLAEFLDLPLRIKSFTPEDVKKVLPEALWLIEEPDILKVSVAIPFYWIAEVASKMDIKVLLAGQGCDELFGGYHRYLREYEFSGGKGIEDALYRDVLSSHEVNLDPDNKACAFQGVELRLPFADYDLALFSLGLPANLKIASARDHLRKRVLREVAKRAGLPSAIYNARKRAIQYSTRIDRVLRKLAREEGLSLRDFIRQSFLKGNEIYSQGSLKAVQPLNEGLP